MRAQRCRASAGIEVNVASSCGPDDSGAPRFCSTKASSRCTSKPALLSEDREWLTRACAVFADFKKNHARASQSTQRPPGRASSLSSAHRSGGRRPQSHGSGAAEPRCGDKAEGGANHPREHRKGGAAGGGGTVHAPFVGKDKQMGTRPRMRLPSSHVCSVQHGHGGGGGAHRGAGALAQEHLRAAASQRLPRPRCRGRESHRSRRPPPRAMEAAL